MLTREKREPDAAALWDGLERYFDMKVVRLSRDQIKCLDRFIADRQFSGYGRVLFDIPLPRVANHYPSLKKIPGLVFYEEDACQEYVPNSKYYRKFAPIFRYVGAVKVIVTNRFVAEQFSGQGVDTVYIPKFYDNNKIYDMGFNRDIEFGFIGRTDNRVYRDRARFLGTLEGKVNLQLFRTSGDREYCEMLNRIKFFVSADIGYREYMYKNFEAMAAGCVLVAKRQGLEEESLGFEDMVNVVLYDSLSELLSKVTQLEQDDSKASAIAEAGKQLVATRHRVLDRVKSFADAIADDIRCAPALGVFEKLRYLHRWR